MRALDCIPENVKLRLMDTELDEEEWYFLVN